jgi:hypothetical protein
MICIIGHFRTSLPTGCRLRPPEAWKTKTSVTLSARKLFLRRSQVIREQMQVLLKDLGVTVGVPDLEFDENGYCVVYLDEIQINMELGEEDESLFFYTHVGEVPEDGRPEFYEMLLDANWFYKGTAGATLGIDKDSSVVSIIYRASTTELDTEKFQKIIENFANLSENWMSRITEFKPGQDEIQY